MAKIKDLIKEKEELQIELDSGTSSARATEINNILEEIDKIIFQQTKNNIARVNRNNADLENKEKRKFYSKEYGEKHKEKRKLFSKEYREKYKEKIKAYSKMYYENNKEKISKSRKQAYQQNKERKTIILQAQSKAIFDGIEIFLDSYNFAEENIIGEINIGNIVSNAIKSLELQDISLNEQEKTDLQEFTVEEIDRFFESL